MMTGLATPETVTEALALGARDVIGKPFDLDDLENILLTAVQEQETCRSTAR